MLGINKRSDARNERKSKQGGVRRRKKGREKKAGAIFGAHVTTGSRWAGLVVKGKGGRPTPIPLWAGKIVL